MSSPDPVTQRDVARVCGVHPSTICLALRNSPSIPLATRQRVQAAAADLGYRVNVTARNLALLRNEKQVGGSLPIAWLNQEPSRHHWRTDPEARRQFDAAQQRATQLGYHLEDIWAREPGMTSGRLAQIIAARGIEGVLFPVHRSFEFFLLSSGWDEFALVGLNDCRLAEWVDLVCPDYYGDADTVFRRARRLNLGPVGLAVTARLEAASNGLVRSCYLRHQADLPVAERLPVCILPDAAPAGLIRGERWLRAHQPAVVVTNDPGLAAAAHDRGISAHWLGLGTAAGPLAAGLDPVDEEIAVAAVECVVDKMRRFETGAHESSRVHLLRSSWVESPLRQAAVEPEAVVA